MNHCINSTPSCSLQDDLKESALSRYNRTIAKVQISEHARLWKTADFIIEEANTLLESKKCTDEEIETIRKDAQILFDKARKEYRSNIDKVIEEEKTKLDLLLSKIKQWTNSHT